MEFLAWPAELDCEGEVNRWLLAFGRSPPCFRRLPLVPSTVALYMQDFDMDLQRSQPVLWPLHLSCPWDKGSLVSQDCLH